VTVDEGEGTDNDAPVMYCRCGEGIPRSAMPAPGAGNVRYTCPNCGQTGWFGTSAMRN
jgi:hypothetical protein